MVLGRSADAATVADEFAWMEDRNEDWKNRQLARTGEGASFSGLKPAGRDLGPAIPAADKALEDGSVEPVVKLLTAAMRERLRQHFDQTVRARAFNPGDVTAGRAYVKAYVEFIHYVERLFEASAAEIHGHVDAATARR